jgi:hypothetical protein
MPICRFHAARRSARRPCFGLGAATVMLVALMIGMAEAAERARPASERGTARQSVAPGQVPSSRREPSRIRNPDEAPPTVPNRAPEVVAPPTPPPAGGAGGGGG